MVGNSISHYRILDKIGEGGMGIVYRAQDTRLGRSVALKFLAAQLLESQDARERFVHEAKAAAALDHPNICVVHEIDEVDGQAFLVMAYVDGWTVQEKVAAGPLPLEEALDIAIQTASGVLAAHKARIVHRDIKSGNVMVNRENQVKIMDFGLALLADEARVTRPGATLGTPVCMAPEQVRGEPVDHRADIWALGVLVYEMLTGRLPFRGERGDALLYAVIHETPPPMATYRPDVPAELDGCVERMLAKEPAKRYQTTADVLSDLRRIAGRTTAGSTHPDSAPDIQTRTVVTPPPSFPENTSKRNRTYIVGALIAVLIAGSLGWWFYQTEKVRWAIGEALPEIQRLAEQGDRTAAFNLAREAEHHLPSNPQLEALWQEIAVPVTIETTPPGANVLVRDYGSDEEWRQLGTTPIAGARLPIAYLEWRFEKQGFDPVIQFQHPLRMANVALDAAGSRPPEMVRVTSGSIPQWLRVWLSDPPETVGEYLVDRYEVTNRQYQEFVDAGGYNERKYWEHQFVNNGQVLAWEDAVALFQDATGRPGPSTWIMGEHPEGEEEFPVRGVSWYEAAAYAEFADKDLLTIHHWSRAAVLPAFAVSEFSNVNGEKPAAVGTHRGASTWGAYDLAGNVREWCWNASGTERFILGGAWNDPVYMSRFTTLASPFSRDGSNGFRCMRYLDSERSAALSKDVTLFARDYDNERPVSDAMFELFKARYAYDQTDLNAEVQPAAESEYWSRELVTFDAAYSGERVMAHLLLPTRAAPPYQAVILFPGTGAAQRSEFSKRRWIQALDFVMKSGRALVAPAYWGTFERGEEGVNPSNITWPSATNRYTESVVRWVQDFGRTVDYLETREDIDSDRLAYLGTSWGGRMGAIIPAMEPRLSTLILLDAGLAPARSLPEADQINFVTRVTTPVLLINGRNDALERYEESQLPLVRRLGTPAEHKRHIVLETGHGQLGQARNESIKEILGWLDQYLGTVQ